MEKKNVLNSSKNIGDAEYWADQVPLHLSLNVNAVCYEAIYFQRGKF